MKLKKLVCPFRWESRTPLFQEGVLYVPRWYEHHDLWPKGEFQDVLSSFQSISVEYCSGNGDWIAQKAQENSSVLWIAVEKRFDRVQKIWARKQKYFLKNLLIVCGEALTFTKLYLQDDCIDFLFINFPDPWPKARHAKHRVLQEDFVAEMNRVAKETGEAILVTDDLVYSEQMIQEMLKKDLWTSLFSEPFYTTEWVQYGTSFFEALWRDQGREIRFMKFQNKKAIPALQKC